MEPRPTSENGGSVCAVRPTSKKFGRRRIDDTKLTPLARALFAARVTAGVTVPQLAAHLGIGTSAIANAETARPGSTSLLLEDHVRAAAELFDCDPAPMFAARERSLLSYRLPNLSEEHAETAIALRDAWETATPETLRRVRAAIASETADAAPDLVAILRAVPIDDLVRAGLAGRHTTFEDIAEEPDDLQSVRAAHERARDVLIAALSGGAQ